MKQAYLSYSGPEERIMGGVGTFSQALPPIAVADSIACQYDTEEMQALGWIVTWVEDDNARDEPPSAPQGAQPSLVSE